MLDFNPSGKFTLLSIDGGGMRGLLALNMLAYLEKATGQPLYELFDMVAGTSTGAIIAAGIALKLTAKEIIHIYYDDIATEFRGGRGCWPRLNWLLHGMRHFYEIKPFIDALKAYAGHRRLGDLGMPGTNDHPYRKPIVLFTTKDLRTGNTYYLVNEGPGATMFSTWPVMGAVAASAAAPIYFPPVLGNLIDGGAGVFGNPSQAAAIELATYIGVAPEQVMHISLGTGHIPSNREDGEGSRFNIFNWLQYLISSSIEESALQQALATRAIYPQSDFRRYNVSLQPHHLQEDLAIDLNGVNPLQLNLDVSGTKELDLLSRIGWAYAEAIDWTQPNLMPWDTLGGRHRPEQKDLDWSGSIFV
ncbi:MAG: hypothetical protein CL607_06945 [Anaerolineaceae bacterium]|nr:hypothetical protein [Anaerolineaceae bacterium]